jgi:hypothetical protein
MDNYTIKLSEIIGVVTYNMVIDKYIGSYNYVCRNKFMKYLQSSIDYSAPEQVEKISAHKKILAALKSMPECKTFTISQ